VVTPILAAEPEAAKEKPARTNGPTVPLTCLRCARFGLGLCPSDQWERIRAFPFTADFWRLCFRECVSPPTPDWFWSRVGSLRAQWSVFQGRRGAITGGVDEREMLPSHDCEVCKLEQPLKSASATFGRDWATRRCQSWDSKMEIPAGWFSPPQAGKPVDPKAVLAAPAPMKQANSTLMSRSAQGLRITH